MVRALGRTAISSMSSKKLKSKPATKLREDDSWLELVQAPPSFSLIKAYLVHLGVDPSLYRNEIPPHLFPQWSLPLALAAMRVGQYPLLRSVNGGCRLRIKGPIAADEPLHLRSRLIKVDHNDRRAIITIRMETGNSEVPDLLSADMLIFFAFTKQSQQSPKTKVKAPPSSVPLDAKPLDSFHVEKTAGFDFALLTGDFNPIHWIRPFAQAQGFPSCILHGYSSFARTFEGLASELRRQTPQARLESLDVRFTRPILLPGDATIFLRGTNKVFLGSKLGEPAFLSGTYSSSNSQVVD